MSFKVEHQASSTMTQPTGASDSQRSARDRAIAMLQSNAPVPVANQNQISPEEAQAAAPQSLHSDNSDTQSPSDAPAEAKKPEPKTDPLSAQYAQLARKEKDLRAKVRAQEAAYKAREVELAAREEAIKAKDAEYQSNYISKDRFQRDPISVLTEAGVSYDEITKAILNPSAPQDPRILAEIEKLKAEVQEARSHRERQEKAFKDQQEQQYTQAVTQIKADVKALVLSDPTFEMVKKAGAVNDVVALITKTFNEDGILLSAEEAAQQVEDYLADEAYELSRTEKIQKRLQDSQKNQQQQQRNQQQPQQQQTRTLTNSANASKNLSARERAIAAFKGQLK